MMEELRKNRDNMKYRLADAMKLCMKSAPLEKITVGEIVGACGTSVRHSIVILRISTIS